VGEDAECKDLCTFVNVFFPPPHPFSLSKRGTIKTLFLLEFHLQAKINCMGSARESVQNNDVWPCFRV
jgi:hypothetical protein